MLRHLLVVQRMLFQDLCLGEGLSWGVMSRTSCYSSGKTYYVIYQHLRAAHKVIASLRVDQAYYVRNKGHWTRLFCSLSATFSRGCYTARMDVEMFRDMVMRFEAGFGQADHLES
jgi:hypothetical protein